MRSKVTISTLLVVLVLSFSNIGVVRSFHGIDIPDGYELSGSKQENEKLHTSTPDGFNKPGTLASSNPAPLCGDVNYDEEVSILDIVYLYNYCFIDGPAPPNPADADLDGYSLITVRDIAYLSRCIYEAADTPNCSPGGEYIPVLELADTISFEPDVLPAFDSTITVTLDYKNSTPIYALALPLKITIGGSIPHIDTALIGSRMYVFTGRAATIDTLQGTVNVGFFGTTSSLPAGSDTMLVLDLSISPSASARSIQIATPQLAPSNDPLFVKPSTLDGVVPELVGFIPAQSDDTLIFTAYSPVDLIVIDPADDSIGVDFNFIPDASYDTTQDVNEDGENDDVVTIPQPIIGEYTVKVVGETGSGGGSYTLAVKLNGNEDTPLVAGTAPGPGEVDTVYYTVTEYLRGDANTDGSTSVSDVIFLINYLFKGGPPSDPMSIGDANCCKEGDRSCTVINISVSDVIFLINYLFKGGDAPCS